MRPLERVGAHVRGHNLESIGVCYEGGLDKEGKPADTRTDAQKMALASLVSELLLRFPAARVVGHRDLSPDLDGDGTVEPHEWLKQCPCFNV
jgi:N-acetyl-anhydromuramyl-L-alanine amidase AmpD